MLSRRLWVLTIAVVAGAIGARGLTAQENAPPVKANTPPKNAARAKLQKSAGGKAAVDAKKGGPAKGAQNKTAQTTAGKKNAPQNKNAVFDELMSQGAKFADDATVKLPPPTLADGLGATEQQQALASIADTNHPVEALTRKAVVAPFVLRIADEKQVGAVQPRRVDIWFITYGDLKKMTDETFIKQQVEAEAAASPKSAQASQVVALTGEQLQSRGIEPVQGERYFAASATLFGRVRVGGVMRTTLTRTSDSVLLAGVLDPRFADDKKYPNSWRGISRDEAGEQKIGAPRPYSNAAWYCKATQLKQPTGAVLVEYHLVFDEPEDWFNGANLLRSKLPIVVQDGVRKIRRKLADPAP